MLNIIGSLDDLGISGYILYPFSLNLLPFRICGKHSEVLVSLFKLGFIPLVFFFDLLCGSHVCRSSTSCTGCFHRLCNGDAEIRNCVRQGEGYAFRLGDDICVPLVYDNLIDHHVHFRQRQAAYDTDIKPIQCKPGLFTKLQARDTDADTGNAVSG